MLHLWDVNEFIGNGTGATEANAGRAATDDLVQEDSPQSGRQRTDCSMEAPAADHRNSQSTDASRHLA